jgi:RHS repeat-associated protein
MNADQLTKTPSYGYDSTCALIQGTCRQIFGYGAYANCFTAFNFDVSPGNVAKFRQFTGKERDQESGLDYFGARYYGSALGRFTGPDWSAKPSPVPYADLANPQSLNQYSYVDNNPLARADQDGHSDYTWQKVWNYVKGNGYRTDAQVNGLSVAKTAESHKGSMDWAIKTENTSGTDVGHKQVFREGTNKCNEFVGDTLAEAGKARPEVSNGIGGTRMPTAHELADPKVHIPGLSDPKPLSEAQPGDVIAQQHGAYGHAGIVVEPGQTASVNTAGDNGGKITVNDWGFRSTGQNGESKTDPAPVVRRPEQ